MKEILEKYCNYDYGNVYSYKRNYELTFLYHTVEVEIKILCENCSSEHNVYNFITTITSPAKLEMFFKSLE